jgi:hypothetical protein
MAERIAAGLFAEPQSLDLPGPLVAEFIALVDELDWAARSGAVARWLEHERSSGGFAAEFVTLMIRWANSCLDPYRSREAA